MDYILKYVPNTLTATAKVIYDKYCDYSENDSFNAKTKRTNKQCDYLTYVTYFFGDPIHIIDNLYLGSAFNAASYYKLKEVYKIDVIINATREISNYYPDDFVYKNYNLSDINEDSITDYLENAYQFIETNKDKQILIHCFMGASRSASLMSYYIMKKYGYTMKETIDFITERRKIVNINTTFVQELKDSVIVGKDDNDELN